MTAESFETKTSVSNPISTAEPQSLAAALNRVIEHYATLAEANGTLFSLKISTPLPTWVLRPDLARFEKELTEALSQSVNAPDVQELQVDCKLEDETHLRFYCRDPHRPKDHSAARLIYSTDIMPASNRETFTRLLGQSRGPTSLGSIKSLFRGLKFLVADDSIDSQEIGLRLIRDLGGEAVGAKDGQEAIEKALSGDFDLILMDIRMPIVDGNTAMRRLLDHGITTPVIAVTAVSSIQEREESFKCGFKDYITKPFQFDPLIRTMARLTKRPLPIASKRVDPTASADPTLDLDS